MTPTDLLCVADPRTRPGIEDALNGYLDGELQVAEQPTLFVHLAECASCRGRMDSVMSFRRIAREEYIAVPQQADERFMERLADLKERVDKVDRAGDREPLWQSRRSVSLGTTVFMAACLFVLGLYLPRFTAGDAAAAIVAEQEMVDLESPVFGVMNTVYVITPGVTVESARLIEGP
ncbi:MAG: zf-HC2 domain-containing protein [Rhodothermales bacterium]|nr:zf-HC2 domain-containing protein [Rhodothermales bacterium]MBO6781643.1 zf-HC2 domain-containing protein [Rhodothermales bacterium]